jgi:hypothetical protein
MADILFFLVFFLYKREETSFNDFFNYQRRKKYDHIYE